MSGLSLVEYIKRFIMEPSFQDEQVWVQRVIGGASVIHQDVWTVVRFFGGLLTIGASLYFENPWAALIVFLLFALTDWFDGKVARFRGQEDKAYGALLDSFADKFFTLPIIWWWGRVFSPLWALVILIAIESTGNFWVFLSRKIGIAKREGNVYGHVVVGKIKFTLQIVLICFLWAATYLMPSWMWWPLWINLTLGVVTVLAGFSVVCKINPELVRFLPDFLTAGNLLCGLYSIKFAEDGNLLMAAALIINASAFDFWDGYVARRVKDDSSRLGPIMDDIGDFVSFAVAPAVLAYCLGVPLFVTRLYVALTLIRLIYFTVREGESGVFDGVPSTSIAVFIASLILTGVGVKAMLFFVLFGGFMEVLFVLQWYHFRYLSSLNIWIRAFVLSMAALLFIFKGMAASFVLLSVSYMVLFFRPLADKIQKAV